MGGVWLFVCGWDWRVRVSVPMCVGWANRIDLPVVRARFCPDRANFSLSSAVQGERECRALGCVVLGTELTGVDRVKKRWSEDAVPLLVVSNFFPI